ncbi:MAG: DEAD/DEAH box helicase family protein [Methylococcales bacterium]
MGQTAGLEHFDEVLQEQEGRFAGADRNILADQAFNDFSAFTEDAMVRIAPEDICKKGRVPKNGNIFFTIFQTFMSGPPKDCHLSPYFGEYPPDFFDFIVIDECHRGGANDESNWRGILEYFAPAVQLGLTATPKRRDNVDTYAYFERLTAEHNCPAPSIRPLGIFSRCDRCKNSP